MATYELYPIITEKNRSVAIWLEKFFEKTPQWEDLTSVNLKKFNEYLLANLSPNSVKTYIAELRAVINLYKDDVIIPCRNIKTALKPTRTIKSTHCYLNGTDLKKLEELTGLNKTQRDIRDMFLLQAWTGCRLSDAITLTEENINGNILSYTSQKTSIFASVPIKPLVRGIIQRMPTIGVYNKMTYNRNVHNLCKYAGIKDRVSLWQAGEKYTGEKWSFVSSHTARRSFATNLYEAGVPINKISYMMGHSNTTMTERYICSNMEITDEVANFFK